MKLEEVTRNYDRAARYYDRLTDVFFKNLLGIEAYRRQAIESLGNLAGARVLDVGCGTGRNLPLLVSRVGHAGSVVAVDYSDGMLAKAQRRVDGNGWTTVSLARMDAVRLEGVKPYFDAAVSVWCLGIVYDLNAALQRLLEVVRTGGRIAIVDFKQARLDTGVLRWLYPVYNPLLRWTGVDTAQDLDDARLRERWRCGRSLLHQRLDYVYELSYLNGAGFLLTGTVK